MPIENTIHILAAVIWVGGMFFAYVALRPAALDLAPPQRLSLWSRTFARFFPWVWVAVVLLLLSGYWMILFAFEGFINVGLYIHIMQATGILMMLIFLHVFFNQIRILIAINLILGLITIIVGSAGAYFT
jgi:uncharacterized membrane protein